MHQSKKTKAERREAELAKIKRKLKKGATLAGQIKHAQIKKLYKKRAVGINAAR